MVALAPQLVARLARTSLALALLAGGLSCAPALAQATASDALAPAPLGAMSGMSAITPYYAYVNTSMPLRSGPAERFYSVSTLNPGMVVIVDAQSQNWSRVTCPDGLTAFVRAEDTRVLGTVVTLTGESRLRAASQMHGYGGSWQVLLDEALPAGTTLTLVEPIKEGEVVVAYRVKVPGNARAYVYSQALRRASDSEIAAARAKQASLPEANALADLSVLPVGSTPRTTTPGGEGLVGVVPGTLPSAGADGGLAIDVPEDLIGKDRPTTNNTSSSTGRTSGTSSTSSTGGGDQVNDEVITITQGSPTAAPTTTTLPAVVEQVTREPGAEELEPAFLRVKTQPVLEAEFDELIGEYERVLGAMSDAPERRRKAVEQRLQYLRVRAELRDTMRRQQDALARLDQSKVQLQAQLDELARTRYYTIVGTLQPSTVYDGSKLPQMYRVVSAGATAPRTLGYIRKTSEMDLDRYLGQVVGVIGENALDRSLQLNLITPVRVDPLRVAPEGATLPAPAAEPASNEGAIATPASVDTSDVK